MSANISPLVEKAAEELKTILDETINLARQKLSDSEVELDTKATIAYLLLKSGVRETEVRKAVFDFMLSRFSEELKEHFKEG